MHVPTQSVPTRCQAGASASLPLERGRGRRYTRDGVMTYLKRDRHCYRTSRSCPCNFYRSYYDDAFHAKFIAIVGDGYITTISRTAEHEWPFQAPPDVFR